MSSRVSSEIYELVQNAKLHESVGRYNEAAKLLSVYWKNTNERPEVSELTQEEQAEILLRCGSLAGYIGSCSQKKHAQELAQNLIGEARRLFSLFGDIEKLVECETYLALTYLRIGQLDEARSWINSAFKHEIDNTCEARLYIYVLDGMILFREQKYVELVNKCKKLEPLFRKSSFNILQGDFNNNYGYGFMKLGEYEEAMKRFTLAKYFYEETKHYLYLALLENNLAVFFQSGKHYDEAHKLAKSARENFKKLGDKTREGYSIDTRAQIYIAEGKYEEALKCAKEAVEILENGENYCYLVNSMQTKSSIEFHLKDYKNFTKTMIASINIAALHISQNQADKFIDTFVELLEKTKV
jgi:tetratricopeptide (TPR) repeat protein